MTQYKHLFIPWKLGKFDIANRICVAPLVIYTWSDDTGHVVDKNLIHYHELVTGGAGLVIQEATAVCREGRLTLDQLGIWEDEQIDGLRHIVDIFHNTGMPAIIQLSHAGILGAKPEYQVSPVDYACFGNGQERHGRGLTVEELHTIEKQFIAAAERAVKAGYDGVELHGSHGYLISEFLNVAMNTRGDEYRAKDRLLVENIIHGIRRVTPPDFLLGIRVGAFEPTLEDGIATARWLEAQGVDFIDGFIGCDWAMDLKTPEHYPFNASIYGSKRIKEAVSVPVFTVNGIRTGQQAEAILADTGVDMTVIGRAALVNAAWGNDVREGRDPGTCLECPVCMWKIAPAKCPGHVQYLEHQAHHDGLV